MSSKNRAGLAGLGGPGQLAAVGGKAGGEFGFGTRRVRHTELGADPGQVGNVTVAPGLVQRAGAEAGMRAQETVGFGDMDPGQQVRV